MDDFVDDFVFGLACVAVFFAVVYLINWLGEPTEEDVKRYREEKEKEDESPETQI